MEGSQQQLVNGTAHPPLLNPVNSAADLAELQAALEAPFDPSLLKWVVKATQRRPIKKRGTIEFGLVVPYVDPRAYSDRLTLAAGFGRWTREYNVQVIDGVNRRVRSGPETKEIRTAKIAVTCRLTITGLGTQSGLGEEWADDDNAVTAAEAQAFKRACTMFGIGRYLYDMEAKWVELDQNHRPVETPPAATGSDTLYRREILARVADLAGLVGRGLATSILQHSVGVRSVNEIRNLKNVSQLIGRLQNAGRGVARLKSLIAELGEVTYEEACRTMGIEPHLDAIPDTAALRRLIEILESAR